jgi:HPt (histidine-containing phosphotransfer) domain-containing protein
MALNYNLSKVYALSDNDQEFVMQIIELFVTEVPQDVEQIELGIQSKNHKQAYSYSHKIKPTLDLLGMTMAYEEILQIEAWTKAEGKRKVIEATFESVKIQIERAIKEIKKDFDL